MELTDSSKSITILRIKRKRNEEPLDALVVESRIRRKKSRPGAGVFQFAQTVESAAWDDKRTQDELQDMLARKAAEEAILSQSASLPVAASLPAVPVVTSGLQGKGRYTIINQPKTTSKFLTSPPEILVSKDLPPKDMNPDFQMYDAVLAVEPEPPADPEMDKFLPMLNDYLKLHDISTAPMHALTPPATNPKSSASDDYVWDVFYHARAAIPGEYDRANIATVTGLPLSLTDDYDSASDSEEEDEVDEDSNAEEYYKNEYPEDEESSGASDESEGEHLHRRMDDFDFVYED